MDQNEEQVENEIEKASHSLQESEPLSNSCIVTMWQLLAGIGVLGSTGLHTDQRLILEYLDSIKDEVSKTKDTSSVMCPVIGDKWFLTDTQFALESLASMASDAFIYAASQRFPLNVRTRISKLLGAR